VREDLSALEASVASVDRAIGDVFDAMERLRIRDSAIVVFTADHGIAFPHAKMTLYDPGIEVPLIVSTPDLSRAAVATEMISHVDLMPTFLELLGLPERGGLHGRSFAQLLSGGEYEPSDAIFAEKTYHTYYDPMRCVRTSRYKLIANFENAPWQETSPDYDNNAKSYVEVSKALNVTYDVQYHPPIELFGLHSDPEEQHNLADDPAHASTRDELAGVLYRWMERTGDPLLRGPIAQGAYTQRMAAFKSTGSGTGGQGG
jgi:arylsulfatase A-like enzyme